MFRQVTQTLPQTLTTNKTKLRFVRDKLQRGLLPKDGQHKADEMKAMSIYLKNLEYISNPPRHILRSTRIINLLRKVTQLERVSRDGEFSFKKRTFALLEKWNTYLEQEGPLMSSKQSTIIEAVPNEHKDASTVEQQQLLNIVTQGSASALRKEPAVEEVIDLEKSTAEHNIEGAVISVHKVSQPTPPPSPGIENLSEPTTTRMFIDLTSDIESELVTGSRSPRQNTNYESPGPGVAKKIEALRTQLPSMTGEY